MSRIGVLLDESRPPSVREVIGRLLRRAHRADFAVARIRLSAVDLTAVEIAGVERCRVLVGRLDANAIVAGDGVPERDVAGLIEFIMSGRAEIRAGAGASWVPDFSVLHDIEIGGTAAARPSTGGPRTAGACLLGAHFFAPPFAVTGPAFTALLTDPASVAAASRRFEALWDAGYDVGPVVASMLLERASSAGDARTRTGALPERG